MKTFSQKVLERKRARWARRWRVAGNTALFVSIVSAMAATSHYEHQRMLRVEAPTWAEFRTQPELVETEGASTVDGVPSRLTISGERWSVVRADHFKDAEGRKVGEHFSGVTGQTYCHAKTISYIKHENVEELKVTLMHEIFHAGACLHGGDSFWNSVKPTNSDHPGIYHLGEFTASFLHDNPQFAMWMAQ